MLLQNYSDYNIIGELSEAGFREVTRSALSAADVHSLRGVYVRAPGHTVMLYRSPHGLALRVDNDVFDFQDVEVRHQARGTTATFEIWRQGILIFHEKLPIDLIQPDDPTALAEQEDFDFGLLLKNLSNDRPRQARFYAG